MSYMSAGRGSAAKPFLVDQGPCGWQIPVAAGVFGVWE
jgi:hypothetical protein